MTRPNIPARLSFDFRGINNASADYCPRLFTIAPSHTNDPQAQALGHAIAAVPALLEALEMAHSWIIGRLPEGKTSSQCIQQMRDALIAAGYQF